MTPETVAGLRCPVCGGPLLQISRTLRCPKAHSYDLAKEGYANLLAIQRKHAANPGDSADMVRARREFLSAGYYAPFLEGLAELCCELAGQSAAPLNLVDAGCGEGSYDAAVYAALAQRGAAPRIIGFDLAKPAVRLAAKKLKQAAFCVGGSFAAPVRDGWADLVLNIFSPFAGAEFARMLRPGGRLIYAVPTARHLFGLKEVLYDAPYENAEQDVEYPGFVYRSARVVRGSITVQPEHLHALFAMTPYYWKTPAEGAARLERCGPLTTEIGFRFLVYERR